MKRIQTKKYLVSSSLQITRYAPSVCKDIRYRFLPRMGYDQREDHELRKN